MTVDTSYIEEIALMGMADEKYGLDARTKIKAEWFEIPQFALIADHIMKMDDKGVDVSPVSLLLELQEVNFDLWDTFQRVFSSSPILAPHEINRCTSKMKARDFGKKLRGKLDEIKRLSENPEALPEDLRSMVEDIIISANTDIEAPFTSTKLGLAEVCENLLRHEQGDITGLRTGFDKLDYRTGGFKGGQFIIIAARPGVGKCLGIGTNVVMFDGTLRRVEDIASGDLLMGSDSTPRTVLSTTSGTDNMFWVKQNKGIDYRVNEAHILSLKRSKNEGKHRHGDILNIPVGEYIKKGVGFKARYKGYSVPIDFPESPTRIEPYFLGLWLGDGSEASVCITCSTPEIAAYLTEYAKRLKMVCHHYAKLDGSSENISIVRNKKGGSKEDKASSLQGTLRAIGLLGNKHIPSDFLFNSRANRMELLAGLLDTDGYYNGHGVYEIMQKREGLCRQIKYLADSLGFRTSLTPKIATIKSTGFRGVVYRLLISGNLHLIPNRVERRKAPQSTSQNDTSHTGIKIVPDGVGTYYGFELDGDGLFLLEDMTVTHNTTLALNMAMNMAKMGDNSLFFSYEMSKDEIQERQLLMNMPESDRATHDHSAIDKVLNLPGEVLICDQSRTDNVKLRALARLAKNKHNVKAIFVDYIQLMHCKGRFEGRQQEITFLSSELKALAKELDIPVIAMSQFNRMAANTQPELHHLRESGSLEQDADKVLLMWEEGEKTDDADCIRMVNVHLAKHRQGSRGMFFFDFYAPMCLFLEHNPLEPPRH